MLRFDWNDANVAHLARHAITPAEAEEVIGGNPVDLDYQDADEEQRFVQIGETRWGRVLTVISTQRRGAHEGRHRVRRTIFRQAALLPASRGH